MLRRLYHFSIDQPGPRGILMSFTSGADAEMIRQSATAGLLHDIGKLALAANLTDLTSKVCALTKAADTVRLEEQRREHKTFANVEARHSSPQKK